MTSMQVTRISQMDTPKITISSVKKSASCSHGWLRLTVQCIFGTITITSFLLILYMAMSNNIKGLKENRCELYGCRVVCYSVPYYDSAYQDLANAIRHAESNCPHIIVELNEPMFPNYTIPGELISNLRSNIHELQIVGGNMKYIAPHTFMTPSATSIKRLHFEGIAISDWGPESLIGLTNLQEICIENSYIYNINQNALQGVENTLTTLIIRESGYWRPTNLTGGSKLEDLINVYFSYNNFNNILNNNSFARLQRCRVLYLDYCRINAIGQGTFDHLDQIETLFLNNNFLIIISPDTFSRIMTLNHPRPKVNLQDNQWYCDCSMNELRKLTNSGILYVDPLCYYPPDFRDLPFSFLEIECGNETFPKNSYRDYGPSDDIDAILTGRCNDNQDHGKATLISSNSFFSCSAFQYKRARYSQNILSPNTMSQEPNKRKLISARFAMQSEYISMIEITIAESPFSRKYGLLWYLTDCPQELYCVNTLPNNMRVYNVENNVEYTFCPILLHTGEIVSDQCVSHTFEATKEMTIRRILQILLYVCTAIIGTVVGACILYTVIRKFPHLLKGSDRILFVKHKNVDALVLPPKVPLRETTSIEKKKQSDKINNAIFTLSESKVMQNSFVRMKSTMSNKSAAPSYISAMQPTEEQLTEWRLRHHFDNNLTITSVGFDVPYSLLFDNESMYCSIGKASSDTKYESLKNYK